jgi:hypothetical protein
VRVTLIRDRDGVAPGAVLPVEVRGLKLLNAKRGRPDCVEALPDGRRLAEEIDPQSSCRLQAGTGRC